MTLICCAHGGDLLVEVGPGRQVRARAPEIGGDAGDIGVGEGLREARHDDARHAFLAPTPRSMTWIRLVGSGRLNALLSARSGRTASGAWPEL